MLQTYAELYTKEAIQALEGISRLNEEQKLIMGQRNKRSFQRFSNNHSIRFLVEGERIGGLKETVGQIRKGEFNFLEIPHCQLHYLL